MSSSVVPAAGAVPSGAPPAAAPAPVVTARPAGSGIGGTDALLVLMALIWGGNFFAVQYGAAHMDSWAFNATRMTLGLVVLLALALATVRVPWPSRADTLRLLACGVIGNGIYQLLFIGGVPRTRGGSASLILAASPAVLALIGWLTRTEKLTRQLLLGVACSIAGVAMVMLGDSAHPSRPGSVLGNALVAAACLTWGVYATLLRPLASRLNGLHVTVLTLTGGVVPLVALAVPSLARTPWTTLDAGTWGAIAYAGVGAMGLAYVIYYRGLKLLGPTRTSMYGNLQPFIALFIAWRLQNDAPTPAQLLGAAGILGGIVLARRAQ
jgi:drug/metabolite transporter (DMT)-like permease